MGTSTIIAFGLASIIFLSAMLLAAAVFLRGQWDALGQSEPKKRRD
ncbi:MAG: hypothetical protein IVW57_17885 [Ktedonobacterales bacterium]|nr:hypothetical protein [Ktedonobacterales bacterium]